MFRRSLVAIAAMALVAAPLALAAGKAADEECTPDAKAAVAQANADAIDVHALFARDSEVAGNTLKPSAMDVVIARIGPDGKPVLACVSNEEAARRFLASPAPVRRAEEK